MLRSLSAPADGDADNLAVGHDVRADCAPAASKKRKVDSSSDGMVGLIADAKAQRKAFEMVALFPTPCLCFPPPPRASIGEPCIFACVCHAVWDAMPYGISPARGQSVMLAGNRKQTRTGQHCGLPSQAWLALLRHELPLHVYKKVLTRLDSLISIMTRHGMARPVAPLVWVV